MEERKLNVIFNKAGGNAGKNSLNAKITLPKAWLALMEITPENREVKVSFIDGKIIIEKL